MPRIISVILVFIVLVTGIGLGAQLFLPPTPPDKSDAHYPAYERMMANLKAMTVTAHPSGSKELESVRAHLLEQIRMMGLKATIDKVTYTVDDVKADQFERKGRPDFENMRTINGISPEEAIKNTIRAKAHYDKNDKVVLQNILVKLDAPGTDRGILLSAHYDSEPETPGAADDMMSVVALLEAMRKQAGNSNLKSDLYFLFTDGEELGTLGAKSFVRSHPELQNKIDLVVNFEARGNRGPLLMFETSDDNLDAVNYLQSASSRPLSFSFLTALFHRMPNDTDLTRFLQAGYSGLNFAAAEGVEHYGRETDTFANLDRGTAYHYLLTTLEVADHAAQVPFEEGGNQDSLFFPLSPSYLLIMSSFTSYILSLVVVVLTIWWMILQIRKGNFRIRTIMTGTGWLLGAMIGAALLSWGIVAGVTQVMNLGESTNNDKVFFSIFFLMSICTLIAGIIRARKLSLREALAVFMPLHLLLIVGSAVLYQEISYLFSLTTLGILIVALLDQYRIGRGIASIVVGVAIVFLYTPVCWLIYVLFMLPFTSVAVAISVIPTSIVSALFVTRDTLVLESCE
ncbi:M28 family metallopeptidase [Fictibacillus sp. WQ 8-8]|uniref:M28 family metallopeptidase n=1 Tax=Fictibacillus sp. WQ 8-8 TaxID=2938788 RepID=UPI0021096C94|nr:M28 family metallopeptidase [Fictibacillus sp. WQ 8-8]MCQ6268620.1 M28 family metallopeptidase [Fictibacillus sp. WQ 8-8]